MAVFLEDIKDIIDGSQRMYTSTLGSFLAESHRPLETSHQGELSVIKQETFVVDYHHNV